MRYTRLLCLAVPPLWLAAGSPGPDYVRPAVETPAAFKEWKEAAAGESVPAKGWQAFGDPLLDQLEDEVEVSNQNLKVAEAQYRAARAVLDSARSGFFPSASLAASRNRAGGSGSTTTGAADTTYSLSASASWEIDVWGFLICTSGPI